MAEVWALLSDIHGNLGALQRVLSDAEMRGANRVAVLGDILGGLPEDEPCCRLLMREADVCVFGNREVRVRWAVPEDVVSWLQSLRATERVGDALLCHSSPTSLYPPEITAAEAVAFRRGKSYWDLFPYVSGRRSVAAAATRVDELGCGAVFHGHTHRQVVWQVYGGEVRQVSGTEVRLDIGIAVVGLGTVGEGRGGRVEYALYRPAGRRAELVCLDG